MESFEFKIGQKFENVRCEEIAEVIKITEKTVFFKCVSDYCVANIKKSKSNVTNLLKRKLWNLV